MSEKIFIENLGNLNKNYTSPESAQNQANSLESLSTDIYTDSKRFIYELLQNADDASNDSGKLEILIRIIGNYITVSHNGEPFSEIDIESICSVGDGNKKEDENKTGFKGIGFKSVFSHSQNVAINSKNYCLRFHKEHWESFWDDSWGISTAWIAERERKGKDGIVKMPWQIIPIWTTLEPRFDYLKKFNVSTIIQYDDIVKLENELFELFSNTQILLFLRSKEVKITVTGEKSFTIEKIVEDGITTLRKNKSTISSWLIRPFQFSVDSDTWALLENDIRIPKKLRQIKKTEIVFAIQLEKGRIKTPDREDRLVFTYLPTSVNYDFPFLVNASFLTDAGRQHLHEDLYWNAWLFGQISDKLFLWLAELAQSDYKAEILKLIPNKLVGQSDLKLSFNVGFDKASSSIAFIPSIDGKLLKSGEAVFDKTDLSSFLNPEIIIDFINEKHQRNFNRDSLIPLIEPIGTLKRLGVLVFDSESFHDFFSSKIFHENHKLEENFSLINYLHDQSKKLSKGEERTNWNEPLKKTAFIYDEHGKLKSPREIYFPIADFEIEFENDINIINSITMLSIEQNQNLKKWLNYLGVREPSNLSFIEKTIIGNEEFVTKENAIQTGKYLFHAYQRGILEEEHFDDLKTFKVLTKKGSLTQAQNTFLPNYYFPELQLESVYDRDFYLSTEYSDNNGDARELGSFFIRIGVKHKIQWSQTYIAKSDVSSRKDKDYFSPILSEMDGNKKYSNFGQYNYRIDGFTINHFSFSDAFDSVDFAKIFWENVLDEEPGSDAGKIHGKSGFWSKADQISSYGFQDYFEWSLKNLKIFPTTAGQLELAHNVFANTPEIVELVGDFLPVFDLERAIPTHWIEILPLKKSLSLNDYLKVLTAISKPRKAEEDKKEVKKRIELIYEKLALNYLEYSDELTEWAKKNKLMSKDSKSFYSPQDLSIVTAAGFNAPNLALCDENNEKVVELLKIFGVRVIDKVEAKISNSQTEIKELKRQLEHILPLIALISIEKSNNKKDWETEYSRLSKKLTNIHFYETSEICLTYGNEEDRQSKSSWAENTNFYYVGNWFKPRILDALVEPIGNFLGIHYAERHLSVLLADTFQEGLEYIKEKYGEDSIKIIPEELLNPLPDHTIDPRTGGGYSPEKADIGNKGEKEVYEELKGAYCQKYAQEIKETDFGFTIGDKVQVIWKNIGGIESTSDHDFKIIEDNTTIYIDSKATIFPEYTEHIEFELTSREYKLMESSEIYLIARVFNVSSNPTVKFIRLNTFKLN